MESASVEKEAKTSIPMRTQEAAFVAKVTL